MSKTDGGPLGPGFERRLRSELDRIQPRSTAPRYATAPPRVGGWRFAPVALIISVAGMVALTAFVTTGSTNPVVWTQRVVTTLHSEPTPSPSPSTEEQKPAAAPPAVAPGRAPVRSGSAPPSAKQAQPTSSPHERESPETSESPAPGSPRPSPSGAPSPEH